MDADRQLTHLAATVTRLEAAQQRQKRDIEKLERLVRDLEIDVDRLRADLRNVK